VPDPCQEKGASSVVFVPTGSGALFRPGPGRVRMLVSGRAPTQAMAVGTGAWPPGNAPARKEAAAVYEGLDSGLRRGLAVLA